MEDFTRRVKENFGIEDRQKLLIKHWASEEERDISRQFMSAYFNAKKSLGLADE